MSARRAEQLAELIKIASDSAHRALTGRAAWYFSHRPPIVKKEAYTMTAHFTYKVGDTAPAFRIQLLQATGAPQDLTGATASLRVCRPSSSVFVSLGALTVEGGTEGWVNRPWVAGDIDEAGLWDADVPVVFAGGAKQTYPGHGYIRFNVSA